MQSIPMMYSGRGYDNDRRVTVVNNG